MGSRIRGTYRQGRRNVVCHLFYYDDWVYDDWVNFWPLRKFKKTTCDLPGFSSRKKDFLLGGASWNVSTENFEMMAFRNLIRNVPLIVQGLWLLCLVSEKFHVDPATLLHPIPKTRSFRSTWAFSGTKVNSQKQNIVSATFFVRYPNNLPSEFSIEPFWIAAPTWGMKILEESTWLLLNFGNNQKSVRLSKSPIEKSKKTTCPIPCVRDIHSWRPSSRLPPKSTGLPLALNELQREFL